MVTKKRTAGIVLLAALAALVSAAPGLASHKWSRYHWARTSTAAPLALTVSQSAVGGTWSAHNAAVLGDWNAFSGGVLTLAEATSAVDVTVESASYGATGWLGVAQIRVDVRGHIVEGRVRLNDYYYGAGSKYLGTERAVYCQEIGHIFGLDHNRDGKRGGTPDDSCMNDWHFYTSPNVHDTQQLVAIYNHGDGYSTASSLRKSSPASGWITIDRVRAR